MNITDLISGGIGSKAITAIANVLKIDESKAKWLVAAAVPLMIAALRYNSSKSKEKEEGINKALEKHNGSIFDQIGNMFGQGPTDDDSKIVQHMFGKNTEVVKDNLAQKTGLSADKIGGALAILAPLVMGYLGKQKSSNTGGGISDMIGNLLGGSTSNQTSNAGGGFLGNILGSILGNESLNQSSQRSEINDLGNLAGDFFSKQKDPSQKASILDTLANMFGK